MFLSEMLKPWVNFWLRGMVRSLGLGCDKDPLLISRKPWVSPRDCGGVVEARWSPKLWRRGESLFHPIFPGPQAILKPATALPQGPCLFPWLPSGTVSTCLFTQVHVECSLDKCCWKSRASCLRCWTGSCFTLQSLLHLIKCIFPAKGKVGWGQRRVRRKETPTLSYLESLKWSHAPIPPPNSFIQQTLIEDLACGRNYVMGHKYA